MSKTVNSIFNIQYSISNVQMGAVWLAALLAYLTANRDFAVAYLSEHLPAARLTVPESACARMAIMSASAACAVSSPS